MNYKDMTIDQLHLIIDEIEGVITKRYEKPKRLVYEVCYGYIDGRRREFIFKYKHHAIADMSSFLKGSSIEFCNMYPSYILEEEYDSKAGDWWEIKEERV